jgi:hypothetical protein
LASDDTVSHFTGEHPVSRFRQSGSAWRRDRSGRTAFSATMFVLRWNGIGALGGGVVEESNGDGYTATPRYQHVELLAGAEVLNLPGQRSGTVVATGPPCR